MWFRKNKNKEVLSHHEITEKKLKLVKDIDTLLPNEVTNLIVNGKEVPEVIKIKLYDFIVEFNILDSMIDSVYKTSLGIERSVSSTSKGVNTMLNELFKSKDGKLESFLKSRKIFKEQELSKALVVIRDAIKLRDRIAHAIPLWHAEGNSVLFYSYDGVFWNKFYNNMRKDKSKLYEDKYFKKQLNQTILSENSFTYVVYHVYEINFQTEKVKDLCLRLLADIECKEINNL